MDIAEPVQDVAPLLSVVVPVYNAEEYLAQCLDSILAQTMGDFELICVDDGSTDGSPAMLATYAARDSRVAVVRQKNAGVSAARNVGIDRARGRYINFLDADDWFEPQMFECMCGALERDGADVCVCSGWRYDMRTGERRVVKNYLRCDLLPNHLPFAPAEAADHLFDFTVFLVFSKVFRLALLRNENIRFRPYRTNEDGLFYADTMTSAGLITVVDEPLYTYRVGTGSSLSDSVSEDILAGYRALCEVQTVLQERGVYGLYRQSFTNKALSHLLLTQRQAATYCALEEWYECMVGGGFAELGLSGHEASYFYNQANYDQLQLVMSADGAAELAFALYRQNALAKGRGNSKVRTLRSKNARLHERNLRMLDRVANLKERVAKQKGRIEQLEAKNAQLAERNERLRERNEKLSGELERIKGSRTYRFARRLSAVARMFRR